MTTFKRGSVYWYEFNFAGQRIRESSKSTSKGVAERLERERRRKLELGVQGLEAAAKPLLFSVAVKNLLLEQEPHWAPKTRIIHANSLRHLAPYFGKLMLSEIRREHISKYQSARLKEIVEAMEGQVAKEGEEPKSLSQRKAEIKAALKRSKRSINIEISLVRMVLGKKLWVNLCGDKKIMLRENEEVGKALPDDQMKRLLAACKASISRGLYPAVLTSYHTGLRSEELRLLRWHQVDLLEGTITVGKSKTEGGEGRLAYLSALAVQTLQNWRSQFPDVKPNHAVFPREKYGLKGKKGTFGGVVTPYETFPDQPVGSFATAWGTAKKAAGVACRWHDLRHSACQRIAAGGATDQTLQALLGWMSPKMIERYSHVRADAKRRAVAVFDVVSSDLEVPTNLPQSAVVEKQKIM